ncbi:MaoC/PaaZ C-terminal domain-containing protein [Actinophytocola sediminis]
MPIDPTVAIGADLGETAFSWTSSDVLLYHLGLGAGALATDPRELRYVLEDRLVVLPTFGVVAPGIRDFSPPAVRFPGIDVDLRKVLHGTQSITVHGPIPAAGDAVASRRIVDVLDKGKAAVIVQETSVSSADTPLWTALSSIFVRDEGGFGGHRGPATEPVVPTRAPDEVLEVPTLPQQALLYRLSGDRNPLHADPEFAALAGFARPILHGLCTYGVVCKSIVDSVLAGAVGRVAGVATRFAGVCYPGETLRVRVWAESDQLVATATAVQRDDAPVLTDTVLTLTPAG